MNAAITLTIERAIARAAAEGLIAAGYKIAVYDGEETVLKKSADVEAILDAMFATDQDRFDVYHMPSIADAEWERVGWVLFIHGNGVDTLSDYTVNLEAALQPAIALAVRIEAGDLTLMP